MRWIAVSQRVTSETKYYERRDALDQKWAEFLHACQLMPLLLPNHGPTVKKLLQQCDIGGILLTGGNDLCAYQGDAPERDTCEKMLLEFAIESQTPLLGVCRGMQFVQHHFAVKLKKISGHVTREQTITLNGQQKQTNSFHNWGTTATVDVLNITGIAQDGVIKAIEHKDGYIKGIMWHPERQDPFDTDDIQLFQNFFNVLGNTPKL